MSANEQFPNRPAKEPNISIRSTSDTRIKSWSIASTTAKLEPTPSHSAVYEALLVEDASKTASPRRTLMLSRARRIVLDTWFCEIVTVSFSCGCFVTIGIVLRIYDNEPVPKMPHGLTLNAVVSILATTAKSSLLCVVAIVLGQFRWSWLQQRDRSLEHLQALDDASRGPLGAFGVPITGKCGPLASFGAIITLPLLAFDSFLQLLVTTPVQYPASITLMSATSQNLGYTLFNERKLGFDYEYALTAGIWSPAQIANRNPTCPAGNCTYPVFKSVEWCTACEEVTINTEVQDCTFGINLPSSIPPSCLISTGNGKPVRAARHVGRINATPANSLDSLAREITWIVSGPDDQANYLWHNESDILTNEAATYAGIHAP